MEFTHFNDNKNENISDHFRYCSQSLLHLKNPVTLAEILRTIGVIWCCSLYFWFQGFTLLVQWWKTLHGNQLNQQNTHKVALFAYPLRFLFSPDAKESWSYLLVNFYQWICSSKSRALKIIIICCIWKTNELTFVFMDCNGREWERGYVFDIKMWIKDI